MNRARITRRRRAVTWLAAACCVFVASAAQGVTQAFGPTPYTGFIDSPFFGGSFQVLALETFEDGLLDSVGASTSLPGIVIGPDPQADSVDADDGLVDGDGSGGRSFFSVGLTTTLSFSFDAVAIGGLPTHAGLVWTDVGQLLGPGTEGFADARFDAFDAADQLILSIGPTPLGDGSTFGQTAEDRFFGLRHDAGIARIALTMPNSDDFEVDHLQYGIAMPIPVPGAVLLLAGPLALLARSATRR